eukprot:5680471-Pleurochrysis_carterae.AAC.1
MLLRLLAVSRSVFAFHVDPTADWRLEIIDATFRNDRHYIERPGTATCGLLGEKATQLSASAGHTRTRGSRSIRRASTAPADSPSASPCVARSRRARTGGNTQGPTQPLARRSGSGKHSQSRRGAKRRWCRILC